MTMSSRLGRRQTTRADGPGAAQKNASGSGPAPNCDPDIDREGDDDAPDAAESPGAPPAAAAAAATFRTSLATALCGRSYAATAFDGAAEVKEEEEVAVD
ncbi:hypothetical protein GWI33_003685 [Rhynchophorus ferrugineus]|uniref:Uncharacterized protein n=1 Tax=Rhynchophorus ferrugineus TaxID=354439 RepID=A0A834M0Z7_RHYFE|nr:hypothetical protein GWI33_003688 [Rhynchophorus ferrugineus]KAF7263055.1 hypothetical protein GWI33_003685 [Rhynchophorus ferrugineus]